MIDGASKLNCELLYQAVAYRTVRNMEYGVETCRSDNKPSRIYQAAVTAPVETAVHD